MTQETNGLKHYLITGGAGFIGSNLCLELLSQGHAVTVLDNFFSGKRENLAFVQDHEGFSERFTLVEGDIRDLELLTRLFGETHFDAVFHMAAIGSVPLSVEKPLFTHEVNATGTLNILESARKHQSGTVVFSGSCAVYGDEPTLPKQESMAAVPISPYASQKYLGELYARNYHDLFQLPVVCLRYFNVFGQHQDPASLYAAVIPIFISRLLRGEAPSIFGDGEQSRDFIYVKDVVRANILASQADSSQHGKVFNIGGGKQTSLNELYRSIQELLPSELSACYEAERAGDIRYSYADVSLAQKGLGFSADYSVQQGLADSIAWYRAHLGNPSS